MKNASSRYGLNESADALQEMKDLLAIELAEKCSALLCGFAGSSGRVLFANEAARSYLPAALTKEDINFFEIVVDDSHREALRSSVSVLEEGSGQRGTSIEVQLVSDSGDHRWFLATLKLCTGADYLGEKIILGSFIDCTQLKKSEELRRQQNVRLRRLGDTLPNGGIYQIVGRPDGASSAFTYVSAGIERLLGVSAEVIQRDEGAIYNLIHPDDRQGVADAESSARKTLSTYEHEFRLLAESGEERWVLCRSAPELRENGDLVWDGILVDITRLKHVEHALLEAKAAVETESRLKDEFLAMLSHELRSPLHAILGWTQLIRRGRLHGEDFDRGMDVIERSTKAQAELIDDLLDVSRIVTDKLTLDTERLRPLDVIETAVSAIESTAIAKGVVIDSRFEDLPALILADSGRLRQVFTNLLSNAVKFTPSGGKVSVHAYQSAGYVIVVVKDSGIGIEPGFLPHVFERFRQANASSTRKFGGLGLGLSIVKKLVELHGGDISVASAGLGAGATFTVRLPYADNLNLSDAEDAAQYVTFPNPISFTGLSVLVVDDDDDSREIIRKMFEAFGSKVHAVASAQEALSVLPEVRPQLLISDISMPDMDGYQFLSRVRKSESGNSRLPAIALTALARSEDRSRVEAAGFDCHVPKPVDQIYLAACVEKLLNSPKVART